MIYRLIIKFLIMINLTLCSRVTIILAKKFEILPPGCASEH